MRYVTGMKRFCFFSKLKFRKWFPDGYSKLPGFWVFYIGRNASRLLHHVFNDFLATIAFIYYSKYATVDVEVGCNEMNFYNKRIDLSGTSCILIAINISP